MMMLNCRSGVVNPDFCMRFVSGPLCTFGQYPTIICKFSHRCRGVDI